MPFVNAKCTNCGANLEVDNSKDAAIYPYCNTPYIIEKAINNYNTTNNITADVVNVYGGNSADFVIRAGELVKYNGASVEVYIPNTVKIIKEAAFANCRMLEKIILPNSVIEISANAFYNCKELTVIVIPDKVISIGDCAFQDCTGLTEIILPDSVTEIGSDVLKDVHHCKWS